MITRFKHHYSAVVFATLLFVASPPVFAQGAINLPDFGDSTGQLITPEEERKFGKQFYEFITQKASLNNDLEVHEYIQALGQHLVKSSDLSHTPFHFFVVMDPEINAFAGPGGYIGVNAGLILKSDREGELASVMAHEIAHVTQRHLYRAYEASKQLSVPATMATIASLLLGFVSPELAQAALIATQAGSIQYQINFTRENEQEADRVGMQILSESEYDPRNMVAFFQTLQNASRLYGSGPPEFLRTHPLTTSRIADAAARAERYPRHQDKDSLTYELIKVKLELAEKEKTEQVKKSTLIPDDDKPKKAQTEAGKTAEKYRQALEYYRHEQPQKAIEIFQTLLKQYPQQQLFMTALAKAEAQAGHLETAINLWKKSFQRFPERLSILMPYTQTLLEARKNNEARELLQHAIWSGAKLPELYKSLAETYYKLNQKAQAHRYLGEYHHLRGELDEAVTQLRLAGKTAPDNFYMTEIVAEQLKQIRKEIKERKEES